VSGVAGLNRPDAPLEPEQADARSTAPATSTAHRRTLGTRGA
jgi:hypothetical protein